MQLPNSQIKTVLENAVALAASETDPGAQKHAFHRGFMDQINEIGFAQGRHDQAKFFDDVLLSNPSLAEGLNAAEMKFDAELAKQKDRGEA